MNVQKREWKVCRGAGREGLVENARGDLHQRDHDEVNRMG